MADDTRVLPHLMANSAMVFLYTELADLTVVYLLFDCTVILPGDELSSHL